MKLLAKILASAGAGFAAWGLVFYVVGSMQAPQPKPLVAEYVTTPTSELKSLDGPAAPISERFVAAMEAQAFAQGKIAQELHELRSTIWAGICTAPAKSKLDYIALNKWVGCTALTGRDT